MAQEADGANNAEFVLEEIVVSGEKVERSLKETASSVTVLTSTDNGKSSIAEAIGDLANILYASTVSAPIIRGQDTQGPNFGGTAFFGGTIPRATINLDGHYQNFYEFTLSGTSVWDLKSIEVFRGPQTTSQGANSIAGAIIINTKDPSFESEGAYQGELASYGKVRGSLALSGPIVSEELAARVAVDYWQRDTFVDYANPVFAQGDTDLDFRSFSGRAKLLWTPSKIEGLTAKLTYSHTSGNSPTWEIASAPYDELENMATQMPSWEQNTDTGVLDISYDIGETMTLFNQSSYSDQHIVRTAEPAENGSAVVNQSNLTNETHLTFDNEGSGISGVVGLYLAKVESDDTLYLQGISAFEDEKNHLGAYSEVSYELADGLTLSGGLRYQRDSIKRTGMATFASVPLDYDEVFDAWLPKVSIAYDVTDDVTIGALVNRGYNPGGVNLSFVSRDYIAFKDETVWNYELFFRSSLLDKRLLLNGNIFYSDYKDSQRLIPDYLGGVPFGAYAVNADSATAYGVEVDVKWLVLENFSVSASGGLLETNISKFATLGGSVYEGNDFPRAPKYSFSVGVDWDILPNLSVTGKVRHSDGYYSDEENEAIYEVGSYTIANASLSYSFDDAVELYVFVNNIFDDRSPAALDNDRSAGGLVATTVEPRVLGVGFKGKF